MVTKLVNVGKKHLTSRTILARNSSSKIVSAASSISKSIGVARVSKAIGGRVGVGSITSSSGVGVGSITSSSGVGVSSISIGVWAGKGGYLGISISRSLAIGMISKVSSITSSVGIASISSCVWIASISSISSCIGIASIASISS